MQKNKQEYLEHIASKYNTTYVDHSDHDSKFLTTKMYLLCLAEMKGKKNCDVTYCRQRYNKQRQIINNPISPTSKLSNNSSDDCDAVMTSHDSTSYLSANLKIRETLKTCFNINISDNEYPSSEMMSSEELPFTEMTTNDIRTVNFNPNRAQLTEVTKTESNLKLLFSQRHSRKKFTTVDVYIMISIFYLFLFMTSGVSATWWSPGSNSNLVDSKKICNWARKVGGTQADMCQHQAPVVTEIEKGIKLGAERCEWEMRGNRWNCSQERKPYFSRVLKQEIRETAFVQALTAAAITYQITSACSSGVLEECGCTNSRRLKRKLLVMEARKRDLTLREDQLQRAIKKFKWGGCGDNIEYGYIKSKQFLNVSRGKESGRRAFDAAVKFHNQEAGRLAIMNHKKKHCRCHGLSQTCTMWTCWDNMRRFEDTARRLKNRYDYAVRVASRNGGRTILLARRQRPRYQRRRPGSRKPRSAAKRERYSNHTLSNGVLEAVSVSGKRRKTKSHRSRYQRRKKIKPQASKLKGEDLIFFQKSPTFCSRSKKHGSLGTRGRICDPDHKGTGSCQYMCCGRGYRRHVEIVKEKCNCNFVYCCEVVCEECEQKYTRYRCL